MTVSNNQQEQKNEQDNLVQDWIDSWQEQAIRMSEDEEYRKMVSGRATNWGKGIQAEMEARIRIRQSPELVIE